MNRLFFLLLVLIFLFIGCKSDTIKPSRISIDPTASNICKLSDAPLMIYIGDCSEPIKDHQGSRVASLFEIVAIDNRLQNVLKWFDECQANSCGDNSEVFKRCNSSLPNEGKWSFDQNEGEFFLDCKEPFFLMGVKINQGAVVVSVSELSFTPAN